MNIILIPKEYGYEFTESIVKKYIQDIRPKLVLTDLLDIDVALNKKFDFPEITLAKEIILYALDNIVIRKRSQHWSVEFNPIINYPKTRTKMITLLKFISYGDSSTHGNPILINESKKLNKDLKILYKIYINKGFIA